jgi:hypothetical protein
MPRVQWPLRRGRPCLEVVLTLAASGQPSPRTLLADSGAGSRNSRFHLVLDENDCLLFGGNPLQDVTLGGAYAGVFPTYGVRVLIPVLGFDQYLRAVGVPSVPTGFDGMACFPFLRQFTYGNFGDPDEFGLET